MPLVGKARAIVPLVVAVTVASCSLLSDDDNAVIDADQSFCGELQAAMSQSEPPFTMQAMADIYSGLEPPEGLEAEYQVFVDFYVRIADPDFVYDEEATQWVDSNKEDLDAVHSFIGEQCDIDVSSPATTQAPETRG